jgi:gamma-glutamyltranspeptidase
LSLQPSQMGHVKTIWQLQKELKRRAYADRNYFLRDLDCKKLHKRITKSILLEKKNEWFFIRSSFKSRILPMGKLKVMKATKPMHYQIVDSKGNQFRQRLLEW